MTTVSSEPTISEGKAIFSRWLPAGVGLAALFLPTYFDLARGMWTKDEYLHGPIVLAVSAWLVWQERKHLRDASDSVRPRLGMGLVAFGALVYALGRSQDIIIFEVGSQVPVLAGTILAMCGTNALRRCWFPLFFLVFMLPIPGFIVDMLTGSLKQNVSAIAEHLLYAVGYPVGRSGVVLTIGPYQLLVADACSGLHSLISMSAMGLLYLYLIAHKSVIRNVVLALGLLPIAFVANVVRVVVLVLITYHFGDAAGQGFIHDFSGVFLFVIGLLLVFAIDGALGRISHRDPSLGKAS